MAESSQGRGAVLAAWIGLILGPLLLLACILTDPPGGLSEKAWLTVGLAALMAVWWSTEAIPIPATSLLPILLIPLLDIDTLAKATAPYANPTIFLFLGGFLLGLAMQRWNLHKRIALATLLAVGNQPSRQIAGFMIATAFISMWVSNTATSIMMLPIGLSVIGVLIAGSEEKEGARFAVALLLGIAYSASVGGIATLIGTPPNALLAAFMRENYDVQIGFGQWMLLGLPLSIGMLVFIWWSLTRGGFRLAGGRQPWPARKGNGRTRADVACRKNGRRGVRAGSGGLDLPATAGRLYRRRERHQHCHGGSDRTVPDSS